ncbi:hypothetical protein COB55_04595 [Candidatus Wolfebacteria bacterium]|nr:MAG: hypothetical protein COB55_04595 [Candidatus Wolfebacteria bacterium]
MNQKAFIFYGRSGSGKGTQAQLLIEHLKKTTDTDVVYIETGAALREFMTRDGYISKMTKDVLDEGGLLPAFIPVWIWTDILREKYTGKEHLVLDGLARRPKEAPVLGTALEFLGFVKPTVLTIDVSHDWAVEKLLARGRKDDNEEDIRNRLKWYDSEVEGAISYFKGNGSYEVLTINGEQTIEEVHKEILEKTGQ